MNIKWSRIFPFLGFLVTAAIVISGCAGGAEAQKGTLEVTVTSLDGNPVSGAEVWVWEKERFGGEPQWMQATGQDGITLFALFPGLYVISLSPLKYYTSTEEALKNVLYLEIKTAGETVKRTLTLPQTAEGTPAEEAQQLSEQPDQVTFSQYFRELSVGRLDREWVGSETWYQHIEKTNIVSPGDSLVLQGEVIKEVQICARYYDTQTKEFVGPENVEPPGPYKRGGFASGSTVNLPPGKYELKCYVGNILVAVLPFQVTE